MREIEERDESPERDIKDILFINVESQRMFKNWDELILNDDIMI